MGAQHNLPKTSKSATIIGALVSGSDVGSMHIWAPRSVAGTTEVSQKPNERQVGTKQSLG